MYRDGLRVGIYLGFGNWLLVIKKYVIGNFILSAVICV
jgi:hypothetical protein